MMKSFENIDVDNSTDALTQSQPISTDAQDYTVNKNIEDLKRLQLSIEMFDEIYDTLNRISMENDFEAMNFAIKERFCDVISRNFRSIFEHSIKECNIQLVQFLIEFGRTINNINDIYEIHNPNFVRFILKIQHFDANKTLFSASADGHHEVVKLLLTVPGIDVNAKNKWNSTALMRASREGHYEVVRLLLAVPGIDVNAKDYCNATALICASFNGNPEVVKLLLTVPGIDVNAKDINNNTALICASFYGRHEVVKLLLAVPGIDVNAKNINSDTALSWAKTDEIRKMLKAHDAI